MILLVLGLLLAGAVEAGPIIGPIEAAPGVHPGNVGKCWEFTGAPKDIEVPCQPADPCLAQMEAAMRAMEPWLGTSHHDGKGSFVDMLVLVDKAKAQCWRK